MCLASRSLYFMEMGSQQRAEPEEQSQQLTEMLGASVFLLRLLNNLVLIAKQEREIQAIFQGKGLSC